jgi:hypothetical protein
MIRQCDGPRCKTLKYCDMHAVGQQSTVETLFTTVAKQRNNGTVVFFGVRSGNDFIQQ